MPNASAIKCINNKIFVSSDSLALKFLEYQKQTLCITKRLSIPGLNEVLMHENILYYTDTSKHAVVMANSEGKTMVCAGEYFNFPNGTRMNKDQEILVCDSNNHRIQVFSTDLSLRRVIGKMGCGKREFLQLYDLVIDEEGNLYVVENGNHRIQVLSPRGEHIRFIGREGSLYVTQFQQQFLAITFTTQIEGTTAYQFTSSLVNMSSRSVKTKAQNLSP